VKLLGRIPAGVRCWLHPALLLALGLGFSFANLGRILRAQWGFQDDHEIAFYIGPTRRMSLGAFFHFLGTSEAAHPGGGSRYRPSYYFMRLTETLLWGAHPELWYLARILMFGLSCAALLWVLRKRLSLVENALLVAYIGTLAMWTDIWTRLGPAEAYACFGVALFIVGVERIEALRNRADVARWQRAVAVALFVVGGAIAIGSKENFVVLALPAIWIAVRARRSRPALASAIALVLFAGFVAVAAARGVARFGHVYREDTTLPHRSIVVGNGIKLLWHGYAIELGVALVLFVAAYGWLRRRGHDEDARALLRQAGWIALALTALFGFYLSQYVFYNGALPAGVQRYDFPALLLTPLFVYIALLFLVRVATMVRVPRPLILAGRAAAVVAVAQIVYHRGFPLPAVAQQVAANTRSYTASFSSIADQCRRHPDWAVVMETYDPYGDYESIASMQRWLYALGGAPRTYLLLHYRPESYKEGTLDRMLAGTLASLSAHGADGNESFLLTRPYAEFHGAPCIDVNFHGPPTIVCSDAEP
jgi:hypothetical protein